jgi:hypothetical protein
MYELNELKVGKRIYEEERKDLMQDFNQIDSYISIIWFPA